MERSHKFDHCDSPDASICQFSRRNLHENVLDCHQARRPHWYFHQPSSPQSPQILSVSSRLQILETRNAQILGSPPHSGLTSLQLIFFHGGVS